MILRQHFPLTNVRMFIPSSSSVNCSFARANLFRDCLYLTKVLAFLSLAPQRLVRNERYTCTKLAAAKLWHDPCARHAQAYKPPAVTPNILVKDTIHEKACHKAERAIKSSLYASNLHKSPTTFERLPPFGQWLRCCLHWPNHNLVSCEC